MVAALREMKSGTPIRLVHGLVPFFTYMQAKNPTTWFGDRLRRETLVKFKWSPRFGHRRSTTLNYLLISNDLKATRLETSVHNKALLIPSSSIDLLPNEK